MRKEEILKKLGKYKKKDFTYKSGNILGSMCTQPLPVAKKAYNMFLETNLGDPALFPGAKKIEEKYIIFIKKLLNAPKNSDGIIVSGGTEGNITAMWLSKKNTGKKEIILPESAHFSFEKISSLMDMKLIPIRLNDKYIVDIEELKEKINKNTAAVVGIAGSTELGTIDPIREIAEICNDHKIFFHVDAAFGGFVIPFLKKIKTGIFDFDFKIPNISTISVDSHKMGCSNIPLGTIIVRDKKWIDNISVKSHCVSSKTQATITGTRSGGPVASAYAVSEYLGYEGYQKIVKKCMKNTEYTEKKILNIGLKPIIKPTMNVIGIRLKKPGLIVDDLSKKGFMVNKIDRISCIRLVLMPHVKKQNIDSFIPIFEKICIKHGEI